MALNKSVSAVPQVVNAVPAETFLGLYLRMLTRFAYLQYGLIDVRTPLDEPSSNKGSH